MCRASNAAHLRRDLFSAVGAIQPLDCQVRDPNLAMCLPAALYWPGDILEWTEHHDGSLKSALLFVKIHI